MAYRHLCVALVAAAAAGTALACGTATFACQTDAQCGDGQCVGSSCAFADSQCGSGLRYGAHAGEDRANACVPGSDLGDTDGSGDTTGVLPATTGQDSVAEQGDETLAIATTTNTDGTSTGTMLGETSTGAPDPVDPDLVAWYRCDGDPALGIPDSSGNGHLAQCSDCPSSAPGVLGNACAFGGGLQRLTVSHQATLAVETFTIAAWVRTDGPPPGEDYAVVGKPVGPEFFNTWELIFLDETGLITFCWSSDIDSYCAWAPVGLDVWTHLAGTYDGRVGRLYIDGELVAQDAGALRGGLVYDDHPLLIGGDIDLGENTNGFVGLIDDVRLYGRALDAPEVAALIQ